MLGGLLAKIFPLIGEVVDRVVPDPQERAKMKLEMMKLAQEGEFRELELALEEERIAAEDRASARAMQQVTKDPVPRWLAVGFVVGFFGILTGLFFGAIPEASQPLMHVLLGALAGGVVQILNYYFGSSAGSKSKQEMLGEVVARSNTQPSPIDSSQLRPLPPKPTEPGE